MDEKVKLLLGAGAAALANVAWNSWPGHEAFKLAALKATSLTGEPQKSPLAFIEHYHYGLASIIAARYAGKYAPLLDGFGAGMIGIEAGGENPFGIGKTKTEISGNITLSSFLTGLLLISLST
jgi:hypothetical protein